MEPRNNDGVRKRKHLILIALPCPVLPLPRACCLGLTHSILVRDCELCTIKRPPPQDGIDKKAQAERRWWWWWW